MHDVGVLVRWSLALGKNIVSPGEKSSFKLFMYMHRLTCTIGFVFKADS